MASPRHTRIAVLAAIVLAALAFRLALMWWTGDMWHPDAYEYGEIAGNLLSGNGYAASMWFLPEQPTAAKPPLYPLLLCAHLWLFDPYGYLVLMLIQCAAGAAACLVLYALGRRMFDETTALLAAAMLAVYPHAAYYARNIQPQCLSMLFLLAIVHVTLLLRASPTSRRSGVLGALYGAALLLESSLAAFLPVSLWTVGKARRACAAILIAALLLVVTPWVVRNFLTFDALIFSRSDLGLNLYAGNSEWSTGALRTQDGRPIWEEIPAEERAAMASRSMLEVNREYGKRALAYMVQHPVQTLGRYVYKTAAFWWPFEWGAFRYRSGPGAKGRFPTLRPWVWAGPFFLGWIGLLCALRQRRAGSGLLLWLFILYPSVYALTVVDGARYRVVLEPFFLLLAAHALMGLKSRILRLY